MNRVRLTARKRDNSIMLTFLAKALAECSGNLRPGSKETGFPGQLAESASESGASGLAVGPPCTLPHSFLNITAASFFEGLKLFSPILSGSIERFEHLRSITPEEKLQALHQVVKELEPKTPRSRKRSGAEGGA
jgi:hypothetical protein